MEIRTSRLVLRSLERAHLDQMLPLITREVAATTLRITHPYKRKDAEEYFDGMEAEIGKDKMLQMSIFVGSSDEYCGSVGLRIEREHGRAELGYWLGVPYWGQGYASEATQAVVAYGFGELGLNLSMRQCSPGTRRHVAWLGKQG
jgi:RimJ/RimL family protein N-acetyltransferase